MVFKSSLIFLFFLQVSYADSVKEYASGNFKEALQLISQELPKIKDSSAFENRIRIAEDIFSQTPPLNWKDLISIYETANRQTVTRFMRRRLKHDLEWSKRLQKKEPSLKEISDEIETVVNKPSEYEHFAHDKDSAFRILSLYLRRQSQTHPQEPDWLFYLGKTRELARYGGQTALIEYLEHQKADSKKKKEAFVLLQSGYNRDYPKGLPQEIETKLKELKKKL